jgi:hypothetical protein
MRQKTLVNIITILSALLLITNVAAAQTPPRFFDTAAEPHAIPRLTIFYPSFGTLRDLLALKNSKSSASIRPKKKRTTSNPRNSSRTEV